MHERFPEMHWLDDRLLLNGLTFRLEHARNEAWDGGEHFRFFKVRGLVDQFLSLFASRPGFRPRNILDLGTFDGGSAAFWFELFRPEKLVSIDIRDRQDSAYFRHFLASREAHERVKVFWRTDQSNERRLREILDEEFPGPVDLVIDDASHFLRPTLASFEAVFPRLSRGGLYIVEDWAWGHWKHFAPRDPAWAREAPLTRFVTELVEAAGTSRDWIDGLVVKQGLVAVERGSQAAATDEDFRLDKIVYRRPRGMRAFLSAKLGLRTAG